MSKIERKIAAIAVFAMGPLAALLLPVDVGWAAGALFGYFAADIWPFEVDE